MAKEKFDRFKPHINVGTIDNATEEKYIRIIIVTVTLLFLLFFATVAEAVVYEPLPNRPEARGFYYWLDMLDYPDLLLSNMPYEVMQGYIVADSVVRLMPSITYLWNPFNTLNLQSDTASYIYKHWYYVSEYDPLRFYAFLRKYPEAKNTPTRLYSELRSRMEDKDERFTYTFSDYILHVYVNNTVWIDTANINEPDNFSETVAYCKILDTLKGGSFPSLDKAIFYNGELLTDSFGVVDRSYLNPQHTDIVFSYIDQWHRWQPYGPPLIKPTKPIPEHWMNPNKEYIVFLHFFSADAKGKKYYHLVPYPHYNSCSMYPIEDGYVIDEKNALGFGEKVPVEIFKQGIMDKINEIKNYGK